MEKMFSQTTAKIHFSLICTKNVMVLFPWQHPYVTGLHHLSSDLCPSNNPASQMTVCIQWTITRKADKGVPLAIVVSSFANDCKDKRKKKLWVFICWGYYDKIPQIWWLINSRILFLIVLESESSRTGCRHDSVRAFFRSQNSHFIFTRWREPGISIWPFFLSLF